MVVSLNRGTLIWTPKYYNPHWYLRFRCGVNIGPAEVAKGPLCLVRRIVNKYEGLGFRVWGLGVARYFSRDFDRAHEVKEMFWMGIFWPPVHPVHPTYPYTNPFFSLTALA